MLFAYYALAQAEERECESKFGQSYTDYKAKTNMFLPFKLPFSDKLPTLPTSNPKRILVLLGIYAIALSISIGLALILNSWTVNSLYGVYTDDSATISVNRIEADKLQSIIDIALSNEKVIQRIETSKESKNTKFFNYVLPGKGYIAEIPMNGIGTKGHHNSAPNYKGDVYKIIITKAEMRVESTGRSIVQNVVTRIPVVEVWVNVKEGVVTDIMEMSEHDKFYKDIPVAFY